MCLTRLKRRRKHAVGVCRYIDDDAPVLPHIPGYPDIDQSYPRKLYAATYTFDVFEIRTGRRVKRFTIHSDVLGTDGCPDPVDAGSTGVAQTYHHRTLLARLRPLVTHHR